MFTARMKIKTTFGMFAALFVALLPLGVMATDASLNQQLLDAAKNGDLEQAKSLLSKGADVNAKDKEGVTALKVASRNKHDKIVEFLKAHGAE